MMWFEHKSHYWAEVDHHEIRREGQQTQGILRFEKCYRCGAVRTIEYKTGEAPIIREGVKDAR